MLELPHALHRAVEILAERGLTQADITAHQFTPPMYPEMMLDHLWGELMDVAAEKHTVAILDWKAWPEEVTEGLKQLNGAEQLPLDWSSLANFQGDTLNMLELIGSKLAEQEIYLCNLDIGGDCYLVTFLDWEPAWEITSTLSEYLGNSSICILGVELEYD